MLHNTGLATGRSFLLVNSNPYAAVGFKERGGQDIPQDIRCRLLQSLLPRFPPLLLWHGNPQNKKTIQEIISRTHPQRTNSTSFA